MPMTHPQHASQTYYKYSKILNSNPLRVTKKVIFAKLVIYRFGVFL